ncbi:MAG: UvrD-helicase domain-containing protein, partial [bacterium]
LIPLPEIIADAKNVGANTKTVRTVFQPMLEKIGNEMYILQDAPLEDIEKVSGSLIAEGVRRMRVGEVHIASGYDGEYGKIKIFAPEEREKLQRQTSFLADHFATKENVPVAPKKMHARVEKKKESEQITPNQKESQEMRFHPGAQVYEPAMPASAAIGMIADEHKVYEINRAVSIPDLHIGNKLPDDLNAAQWRAVTYTGGHLLIVAGPGTGKTHTLTQRIAHIVQCFATSGDILAITFTNKAAEEMRQRLQLKLHEDAAALTVGTFHSFCLHFLCMHITHADLPRDFSLATDQDIEHIFKTQWPDKSAAERKQARDRIAAWKAKTSADEAPPEIAQYDQHLREMGLLDFDDLILETLFLLKKNETINNQTREKYQYIFVDEYQDINAAQHALIKSLTGKKTIVTAIGDPNQAIYGFRGSDARYFDLFEQEFTGAKTMHLSDNYRSAKNILSASGQVIAKEASPDLPGLTAKIVASGQLTIHETATEDAEAEYVVHRVEKLIGGTSMFSQDSGRVASEAESEATFGDIAVLYRLNSQRAALEEAFERSGIPDQVSGDRPLIALKGVAQILTVLQLADKMPVPLEKAANLLQFIVAGVGEQTTTAILNHFRQQKQLVALDDLHDLLQKEGLLPERAKAGLRSFIGNVAELQARLQEAGLVATLQHLVLLDGWQVCFPITRNSRTLHKD